MQLKGLLGQGQLGSCQDLIQLILREGHALSEDCRIYLLRAQIAFEESEEFHQVQAWIRQAEMVSSDHTDLDSWLQWENAHLALKEGDHEQGENELRKLLTKASVRQLAQYSLAHHLFWKNKDIPQALNLIEDLCEERPGFIKAWSLMGFIYNRLGRKTEAQEAFAHCLEHETRPEKIEFYRQQLAS